MTENDKDRFVSFGQLEMEIIHSNRSVSHHIVDETACVDRQTILT